MHQSGNVLGIYQEQKITDGRLAEWQTRTGKRKVRISEAAMECQHDIVHRYKNMGKSAQAKEQMENAEGGIHTAVGEIAHKARPGKARQGKSMLKGFTKSQFKGS